MKNRTSIRNSVAVGVSFALTAALLLTGCTSVASSTPSATSASPSGGSRVALPSAFDGKDLVAPAVTGYPPYAYLDGDKIVGISADLALAVGGPWGRTVKLKQDSFENALLGVNSGTYFGAFGADVTAAREKAFDQVSFLEDHYQFMGLTGLKLGTSMSDLCGLKISVVAADSAIPVLQAQSATCQSEGKKPISVQTFADQGAATLAVQSKQVNVTTATLTNLGFIAKQEPGTFVITGPKYQFVLIGIATQKGNGMAKSLADAINVLIANGTYKKILEKYGVADAAISRAEVNPNPTIGG